MLHIAGGVSEIHDKNGGTSFATPAIIAKYYTTTYETGLLVGRRAIALPFHETSGSDFASVASSASGSLSFEAFNNPQRVDGVHGTGLSLNGTSQYLCLDFSANDGTCDATNTPGYGAISFTLSGWFKHSTSISGTDVLMDRRYAAIGGAEGKGWTVEMNSSGNLVFGIQDTAATAAYDDSVTSTQTFNDGLWHHFAAVNTDTALCLYVDGRLTVACDTTLAATLTLDATQYTTIGADLSAVGGANFWDGAIDDIQIAASTAATTQNSVPAHVVRKMYLEGRSALNKGTTIVENATEFSSTTIGDSGETWAPNKFAGQIVEITGGTGAGQTRTIVSNTATTMTVTPAWTVTPDTTSDFESNPETLYGGTSNAVSIQATIPDFQSEYRVYVGTSDGSDGGGITVLSGYGTAHQSDVYHADSAKVDSSGLSWSGTDMDDIKAFAIGDSLQVFATQKGLWSEVGEVDLQQVRDQVTKSLQYIRFELYGDGASATSLEAGTMGGADLAEYYYANEPLEPGDVVAIEPTQPAGITRSMIPYSETMLGVVSTDPGIILGPQAENAYPIALAGRVPVKITDENGPIHVGDYLTSSSRPGYAMRATKAGAVIGKVLNEPETLVACGAELPEMSEAVSEGPGVEVEGGQGAEEIISDAPSTLEEEVSLSGEPQCGYAVVFIALGESRGTNVQTLAEAFTATETVADVTIEFDGLSSATDEERSLETQQMILSFLRALPERVEGVLPQSIFTDRLAAGLDVITPTLLADTITTNILRAGDASSLVVALGEEGRFTLTSPLVQEGDTEVQETPIFEIDAEGNALFAGAIRAKDFLLTSPNTDPFQEQTAILSDAVSEVTTGMGEFALSLSDLSTRVAVLTEEGDALRTKDEELTETLATVSTDRATQLVFNTSVTEGLDLLAARLDVLELQSQNFSESLATLLSEWQLAEEAASETGSLTLAGDLNVAGSAFFTNGIQLDLLGTEGGSLRILSDLWFIGRPYVNSDTAGFARIHEGDTFVRVEFEDAYLETPTVHVDLSFRAPETEGMSDEEAFAAREAVRQVEQQYLADTVRFLVTEKDERGFTIQLNHEAEYDLEFDWFALAVDRPRLSESSHTPIEVPEPPETQEGSEEDANANTDTEESEEELQEEPEVSQEEESSSSSDTEGGDVLSDSPESSQESVPPSEETSDASSESSSDTSSEPSTPSSSESSSESSSGSESAPASSTPASSEGSGDGGGGEGV